MLLSKCAICGTEQKQEANGILSSLGPKTPLSEIPLFVDILF